MKNELRNYSYLIFIQFTISIFLFTLILKCHDDKTDENIHHKESDDLYIYLKQLFQVKKKIITMINAMKNGATNGR